MESLFAVVDAFFVGKVSTAAVAAVGLTEAVNMLIYSVAIGLSAAATAMVARRIGEKKREAAAKAAGQSILIAVVFAFIIGILGFRFGDQILGLMGASDAVLEEGAGYTRIILGTNVVIMLLFLLNGIFRGAGDASLAMKSLWLANGLNIILDPIFIFGFAFIPAMGAEGAAIATSIGRGVGVAFQLWILFGKKSIIRLTMAHLRWSADLVKRILAIAWGGTLQFLIASASWIFLVRIISEFGDEVVAGYTFAIRILIFTLMPSWGMSNAAATLVGQNLGADKPDRAERSGWVTARYNMYFLLCVSVIYIIFAEQLLGIFSNEPEVIKTGVECLRIISLGYVFYAYGMVLTQAFNGAGDTRTPTWMNLFCFWVLEIPLAYSMAIWLEWGPTGVYLAMAISEAMLAVLAIYLFRKGKWKLKIV